MAAWSGSVLLLCFLLQLTLLVLLARRRLAAEVWVFTGLLLFYAVRSAVLYGMAHRMPGEAYAELYNGLGLADLLLQVALAGELLASMASSIGLRLVGGAAALGLAAGVTVGLAALLPARSPAPVDRGVIFTGVLFAVLPFIAGRTRLRGWTRVAVRGLAVVGIAGVLSQCAKSVAAFHRDGHVYVAWSYGNAAVYLAVLVYWIAHNARLYRVEGKPQLWAVPVP